MDAFLDMVVSPEKATTPLEYSPESYAATRALVARGVGFRQAIEIASREGSEAAHADATTAERRAELAQGGVILLLLFTVVLLVLIGGSLRRGRNSPPRPSDQRRPVPGETGTARRRSRSRRGPQRRLASYRRSPPAEALRGDLDAVEWGGCPGALGTAASTRRFPADRLGVRERNAQASSPVAAHDDMDPPANGPKPNHPRASAGTRAPAASALCRDVRRPRQPQAMQQTLGHAAATRCSGPRGAHDEAVRPGDTVCRWAGRVRSRIETVEAERNVVESPNGSRRPGKRSRST